LHFAIHQFLAYKNDKYISLNSFDLINLYIYLFALKLIQEAVLIPYVSLA